MLPVSLARTSYNRISWQANRQTHEGGLRSACKAACIAGLNALEGNGTAVPAGSDDAMSPTEQSGLENPGQELEICSNNAADLNSSDSSEKERQWQSALMGPLTLDAAVSGAVSVFGEFSQAVQQISRCALPPSEFRSHNCLGVQTFCNCM